VTKRVENLLALLLGSANFLVECLRPILESFSSCRALSVNHGAMPPRGSTILSFIL
jgi:hypothetical protein